MTAASPGIIATTMENEFYDSYESYAFARKVFEVARYRPERLSAKALHAARHVHRKSNAWLLAIADNMDPGLQLLIENRANGVRRLALQRAGIDLLASLLPQQQVGQLGRARQAPAMRR